MSHAHQQLKGKVAVVTGASSGIGKAIALVFARAGASVAIADINLAGAQQVVAQIKDEQGDALAVQMDVSNEQAVNDGVAAVAKQYGGKIDILISNAGIQIINPIEDYSFADWKKMLGIHLDGAFLTTKAVVPYMYRNRCGSVIYMGSVHSHEASKLKVGYVTAKHALVGLMHTLAKEAAPHNVYTHMICPGFVRTPLVDKQIPGQAKRLNMSEQEVIQRVMLGGTVDGEFTTTEEIAQLTLFLAAFPTPAVFTGQCFMASHGWVMR